MTARKVKVLVEGPSDEAVMTALIAKAKRSADMEVEPTGATNGKGAFARKLSALLNTPGELGRIGTFVIVRDCNGDPFKALAEAGIAFQSVGLPVPAECGISTSGVWTTQGLEMTVKTAVWLVPGRDQTGNLETLMLSSLDGDERMRCIEELLTCWSQHGFVMPVAVGNADRMRMQIWLSQFVDKKGYIQLGSSLQQGKVDPIPWDFDHSAFGSTIDFFRTL
jgi:hypothetical protein